MVEIRGVHKSFGSLEVLQGIDLTIEKGSVTVILGPSGSGKSTLLRTINHLEKVDRGHVRVDGELIGYRQDGDRLHELHERHVLKQRAGIGFVFQTFNLFPHLTVLENLTLAPMWVTGNTRPFTSSAVMAKRSLHRRAAAATVWSVCRQPLGFDVVPDV